MTQYGNYFVAKEAAATMDRFAIKQTEEAQIRIVVFRMFLNMTDHRICTDIPDFQIIGVGNSESFEQPNHPNWSSARQFSQTSRR